MPSITFVYGCRDQKAGAVDSLYEIPTDMRLNHRLDVTGGCRADECAALLTAFFAVEDKKQLAVERRTERWPSGRRRLIRNQV